MAKKAPANPVGRPEKYKEEFHCEDFIRQSKLGKNNQDIALSWDICEFTLYHWAKNHPNFSKAVKKGKTFCEAWWRQKGYERLWTAEKFDLGLYVWLTKNMFRWNDQKNNTNEQTRSIDDRPLKGMPDEELENL